VLSECLTINAFIWALYVCVHACSSLETHSDASFAMMHVKINDYITLHDITCLFC